MTIEVPNEKIGSKDQKFQGFEEVIFEKEPMSKESKQVPTASTKAQLSEDFTAQEMKQVLTTSTKDQLPGDSTAQDVPTATWTIVQVKNWAMSVGSEASTKILRNQEEMTGKVLPNNNCSQGHLESCPIKGEPAERIIFALANMVSQLEVISDETTTARSFIQTYWQGLSKDVSKYCSVLKNCITTVEDLGEAPGTWIKWNKTTKPEEEPRLLIIFDKGLLEISANTTINYLLKIISKELSKDVSKDSRLEENSVDLQEEETPDSWTLPRKLANKELSSRIHSEKGLLEISINTTVKHLLKTINDQLSRDVSKDNSLKENWIGAIKDFRKVTTPDSWTKWNSPMKLAEELRIYSENGFLVIQSLRDTVFYVVDLSNVPKCGSYNPYGNEQMAEEMPLQRNAKRKDYIGFDTYWAHEDKHLIDLGASHSFTFHSRLLNSDLSNLGTMSLKEALDLDTVTRPKSTMEVEGQTDKVSELLRKVNKFWTNLKLVENYIFSFGSQNPLALNPNLYQQMVRRNCYKDIADIILGSNHSEIKNFLLCGNAGIGKSQFVFYFLARLKALNQPVVYHARSNIIYLFLQNDVKEFFDLRSVELQNYLSSETTWYIVDSGVDFVPPQAKALLISSPKREHYKEFAKSPMLLTLYMPVWSDDELELCRTKIFPEVTRDVFEERLAIVGGIPRFIFERTETSADQIIEDGLSRTDLKQCITCIGEVDSQGVSHILMEIVPYDHYSKRRLRYVSEYVAERVASKFNLEKKDDLVAFLLSTDNLPMYGTLRGHLFEGYCHNIIAAGGTFQIRSLTQPNADATNLEIPACSKFIAYSQFKASESKDNQYYRPYSKTFGAVDSWIKNVGFFQITINPQHNIKMKEMTDCISFCSVKKLFFVVPSAMFDDFKEQNYLTVDNKVATKINKELKTLEQFVMSVSFDSTKKRKQDPEKSDSSKKGKTE